MLSSPFPTVLRCLVPLAAFSLGACAALPDGGAQLSPVGSRGLAVERSLGLPMSTAESAAWPAKGWWHGLGDAQLASLIDEGLAGSPTVAVAAARYRNAQGLAGQARGATLPSLGVGGKAGFAKQSYNVGFPKQFVPQGWQETGEMSASLSFDPDLWGRNRAALAAATSEAKASELDLEQARLMLATGIAKAYVDLARLESERQLRKGLLDAYQATQALVAQRLANGLEHRGGLRLSDAEAARASAELAAADQAVLLRRHQIAALLGAGPDRGLTIAVPQLPIVLVTGLPAGITTDLLGRRPDIAAVRARAAAAASRVKVARADFFPAINLAALIGVQSLGLANLVEGDAIYGNAGPAITLPLFRGGALKGRYRSAAAGRDAALAEYDAAVVAAYQQVADVVTAREALTRRLADSHEALTAAAEVRDIAFARYEGGLANRIDALTMQERLLQSRITAADLVAAARTADIDLIAVLGGGFGAASATANAAAAIQAPANMSKEIPHG